MIDDYSWYYRNLLINEDPTDTLAMVLIRDQLFFGYPFANTCRFQYLCEIFLAMSVKIRANELK